MAATKPLTKKDIKKIKQDLGHLKEVTDLIKEIKRLKRAYIGEELICMSPIAERAGRRVKILINNMNAELAANAAIEGVRELEQEVNKWSAVWVDELSIPFRWKELLKEQSITSVGDLLHMTDKQIMNKVPEFDDNVVFKISIALRRIGVHK